ncbi:MAG: hypothetical protein ACI9A7_000212 [Cyclobacteriaceae bacterium]|jgi:hypothetical protein
MKYFYLKTLIFFLMLVGVTISTQAQTSYVTVFNESFESQTTGVSIKTIGFEVFGSDGGSSTTPIVNVTEDAGQGFGGSNKFAATDDLGINGQMHRDFTLNVGESYRFNIAANCPPTFLNNSGAAKDMKFKILQVLDASGAKNHYYDPAVTIGKGTWETASREFTVVSGTENVRLQTYRYAKAIYKFDDFKLEVMGYGWNGSVSTDWNTAANWVENAVPPAGSSVTIADVTNQPVVTGDLVVGFIEVQDGATLTVNSGASMTVNNDLFASTGYVEVMSGGSLVTLGKVAGENHKIHRQTRFSNGRYSIVGSPIATATVADLGSLVYRYNEALAYNSKVDNPTSGNDGQDRFIEMLSTAALTPGTGYFSANTDLLSFTGKPNTGYVEVPLTYTQHDNSGVLPDEDNYEGFLLVSNPYPSSIEYSQFMTLNSGNGTIENAIWIWDDNGSEGARGSNSDYITVNSIGAVGTESTAANGGMWDGFIRSSQGFFVKSIAGSGLFLAFNNEMRVTGNSNDAGHFRVADQERKETFKLNLATVDGNFTNETLIGFTDKSTIEIDDLDAQKLATKGALKLYSLVGNKALAIQSLPFGAEEIQLGIYADTDGDYSFSLGDTFHWDNGYSIYLNDAMTGIITDLTNGGTYQFSAKSGASDRFSISLSRSLLSLDEWNSDFDIISSLNEIKLLSTDNLNQAISLTLSDVSGKVLFQTESTMNKGMLTVPYNFTSQQIYILSVRSSKMTLIKKFIIK